MKKMKRPFATPHWRKLPKGVWKTDLGPDLPEIVLLPMPCEEFEKFRTYSDREKMRNLNKRRILKRNLIGVVFRRAKSYKKPCEQALMMIYHTPESTGHIVGSD